MHSTPPPSSQKIAFFSLYKPSDGLNFAPKLLDLGWKILVTQNMSSVFSKSCIQAEEVSKFLEIQIKNQFNKNK